MGDKTSISWTNSTWNPIRGCSRVSPGCENCYAERVAARFSGPGKPYEGLAVMGENGPRWTREVRMIEEHLADPLRWQKPRRIFVNSMSDMFYEKLTNLQIAEVFGVMAAARHHTFQVLTKRSERMLEWFEWAESHSAGGGYEGPLGALCYAISCSSAPLPEKVFGGEGDDGVQLGRAIGDEWPLPNVWIGCSVEDQQRADERIPLLLKVPAAVRFLSAEPLLGPIDLDLAASSGLGWVIIGGESGPGARSCNLAWIRSIVEQCQHFGVRCFVKQLGADPILEPGPISWPTTDPKGGDMAEWPEDLRIQEYP